MGLTNIVLKPDIYHFDRTSLGSCSVKNVQYSSRLSIWAKPRLAEDVVDNGVAGLEARERYLSPLEAKAATVDTLETQGKRPNTLGREAERSWLYEVEMERLETSDDDIERLQSLEETMDRLQQQEEEDGRTQSFEKKTKRLQPLEAIGLLQHSEDVPGRVSGLGSFAHRVPRLETTLSLVPDRQAEGQPPTSFEVRSCCKTHSGS